VWITDWRDPARAVAHVAHPIHDLAAAGNLVYFADSAGVWTIRDGGPPVRVPTEGVAGVPAQIVVDGDAIVLRTGASALDWGSPPPDGGEGTYRTTDRGAHWREVTGAKPALVRGVLAIARYGAYEATAYGLYVTHDHVRVRVTPELDRPLRADRY
jgi:hypothetical protein